MSKNASRRSCVVVVAALAGLVGIGQSAHAAVIYSDDFNSGSLGGILTTSETASKTLFFLVNQGTSDTTYVSPVNGATVTLDAGTLDYFYKDNETGNFTLISQNRALVDRNGATAGFGTLNRWA